jgi:hypothetical protein
MNKKIIKSLHLLLFAMVLSLTTLAQKGTVRGFIYNDKTGEAEIGATVFLKGTTMGAATDINGFYSITKIPAGSYTLSVTSLGFTTIEVAVTIKKNELISKSLNIKSASKMMKTFEVSAEKQELHQKK